VNGSSNVEFSCGVFANSSDPGPQLRSQYFGESVLMALGAYAASIFLAYWFGPYITAMANTSIDLLGGGYWFEIMFGFIGAFFIGIFAGLYPVFVVGRGQVSRQSPCVCDS
jgi:hypothetical protein